MRGRFNHYLCHVDKLSENLSSQLSCWSAQHHQLNPLGDPITQGDGTLHYRDVLHAAATNVILIVYKLAKRAERGALTTARKLQGISCSKELPNAL